MYSVYGFYKFKKIKNLRKIKNILQSEILHNKVRGTIIVSKEGINGTLSGKNSDLSNFKKYLKQLLFLKNLILKTYQKVNLIHFIELRLK